MTLEDELATVERSFLPLSCSWSHSLFGLGLAASCTVNKPISAQLFSLSESLSEMLFEHVRLSEPRLPLPLWALFVIC